MFTMPDRVLGLCTLALLCNAALDVTTKPVSPFPPTFSFTGSWVCSGTFRGGKPHRANLTGSLAVGGKWLALTEVDVEPETGYEAAYFIGYDPAERGLVEFDANTFSAATYQSGQGWQAGVLIMESPESSMPGRSYVADRFVYSVTTASHSFSVDWEVKRQHESAWVMLDHLVCKTPETS
jgi:hypothetical protein